MDKVDFKKQLKALYQPSAKDFVLIDVPDMTFVKVDGAGNPNTAPSYKSAVEWLFSVSYGMKFAAKSALGRDYAVMPLEGLWWADDWRAFTERRKDDWRWTMMIMTPDFITDDIYRAAVSKTGKKLGSPPASLRLETYLEGLSAQILHIGSYDDEAPTLRTLHEEFLPANGLVESGVHHEIYLSDPRRTEPAKLKTVLRQPVRRG